MALNRTTELEAVNTMLSAVGEPPINGLDEQKNTDAAIARNILTEVSREVQTQGWHFNSQVSVTMSPDSATKFVSVPENVVRMDVDSTLNKPTYDSRDITQRGDRLFDRTNNTYEFTTNVVVSVVYLFDWTELPEPARRYIAVRAARIFQDRMVGSTAHHSFSQADEIRALALLKEFEADTGDHSIFNNFDTYRIVARPDAARGSI